MSTYSIAYAQDPDGRWWASLPALPGVSAIGNTKQEATREMMVIALRVISNLIEDDKYEVSAALPFLQVLP